MSRDTGYGESKRALAANTSCACCFGAFFFARPRSRSTWSWRRSAPRETGPICDRTDDLSIRRTDLAAGTHGSGSSVAANARNDRSIDREARPAR